MNILVVGNGFDLAHKLPTKYTDFLEWIKAEYELYGKLREQKLEYIDTIKEVKVDWAYVAYPSKITVSLCENHEEQLEIWNCISENVWIDYFLNNSKYQRENWIDFESEICKVIKSFDHDAQGKDFDSQIEELSNTYLEDHFLYKGDESLFVDAHGNRKGRQIITYMELRDRLLIDLNRLTRALETYLCNYVEKINIMKVSPDIKINQFDKIVSFNYTHTYQVLYDDDHLSKYDYIHGEVKKSDTIDTNNMVLGIDEYLPADRKNNEIEFIGFKKYYQRIFKETECQYKDWLKEIKNDYETYKNYINQQKKASVDGKFITYPRFGDVKLGEKLAVFNTRIGKIHELFIFGHSLDATDGDILRDFILNDNVHTIIYYFDKTQMKQQVANLVRIIGQDELKSRVGGRTNTIEFRKQQDMVEKCIPKG